jgi:hypothetical protein
VGHKNDVNFIKGGETMNRGTAIFFGAMAVVFVAVVAAIGKTFQWW